ncbi:hypothetical protein CGZ80_15285 [Rhodopirellula sp. MGV]|nr:hypothetical protein CGZ80_15285 [Rhodopirellula sp. MGV]PNY37412.1 hypothetical protein C2E31_07740 [Rhodopirellula baltica]
MPGTRSRLAAGIHQEVSIIAQVTDIDTANLLAIECQTLTVLRVVTILRIFRILRLGLRWRPSIRQVTDRAVRCAELAGTPRTD